MAKKDLDEMEQKKKHENELKIFLLPKDEDDDKMQLSKSEQEQEDWKPHYFVQIYSKCMKRYVQKKWILELISISKSDAGGLKEVIFSVNGNNIYSYLKFESGVHRVQKYLRLKLKEEFIHLPQQLPFFQKLKKLIFK